MDPYIYRPLEDGHIRLVRLSLTPSGTIRAEIKHVHLDVSDPPGYKALSYAWGLITDPVMVPTVDSSSEGVVDKPISSALLGSHVERSIGITATLNTGLRSVVLYLERSGRHVGVDHSKPATGNQQGNDGHWIWIDQVCINQSDPAERSIQVGMMNPIFKCASVVIAWTGEETATSSLGAAMVRKVGKVAKGLAKDDYFTWDAPGFSRSELESHEEVSMKKSQELGIGFDERDSWVAFSQFFDRPWFERIWIVQEILPAREAIILCGQEEVVWDDGKNAAAWYSYKAGYLSSRGRQEIPKRQYDGVDHTVAMNLPWNGRMGSEYFPQLLGQKKKPSYSWALQRLLRAFRARQATDPRDKLYALLGLSDFQGSDKDGKGIKIDYTNDIKTIFTEATRAIIMNGAPVENGSLDILLDARKSTCSCDCTFICEDQWPSWVPDWRKHFGHGCQWGVGDELRLQAKRPVPRHERLLERDAKDIFKLKVEG